MVDRLLQSEAGNIRTSLTIRIDNILVSKGHLTEGGLIENMAQSAAAGTCYFFKSLGKEVPVGYIGAVKNVMIIRMPVVNEVIETELKTLHQVGNANIVEGKIFSGKEMIASCELTIFVKT